MNDNEIIEMTSPSRPKIGQLRLILLIAYIVLITWLISLYAASNGATFDEMAWCIEWNAVTVNEWVYDDEWGCIRLQDGMKSD
jgi:hypothetical protein